MAIPFNVDDGSDEVVLQRLFSDLFQTLQQIAVIQRNRINRNSGNIAGVPPNFTRGRPRDAHSSGSEHNFLTSAINLALSLSPAGAQNDELETLLQTQNLSLSLRRLRRRSQSELSHGEVKPVKVSVSVEVTNKDWIQNQAAASSKKGWYGSDSFLSKLVPAPLVGPLCTAVICLVGWHLFRSR